MASSSFFTTNEMIIGTYSNPVFTLHLSREIESVMQERLIVADDSAIVILPWNLTFSWNASWSYFFIPPSSFQLLELWAVHTWLSGAILLSWCFLEAHSNAVVLAQTW